MYNLKDTKGLNRKKLHKLLLNVKRGKISIDEAMNDLIDFPYSDIGFAVIDTHRETRHGVPEVVMAHGKTIEQLTTILKKMRGLHQNVFVTRLDEEKFKQISRTVKGLRYNALAKTATWVPKKIKEEGDKYICIVTAGTSDIPVAEESAETAMFMGTKVRRFYDIGVAGIHRLFSKLKEIRGASAVIVVAGMEGALPSVIGGLVPKPIIAVPTSTGYGASLGGIAALLGILNSCAPNVVVVNIDNGFGAGYVASLISRG